MKQKYLIVNNFKFDILSNHYFVMSTLMLEHLIEFEKITCFRIH